MVLGRNEDEDKEEDEPVEPQWQRPFSKWIKQLLDGKEPPTIEEEQFEHCRSKSLEEQRRAQEHLVNYALMIEVICAKELKCLTETKGDDRWIEAMQSEYGSIMKNNTWNLVDWPPKCKVIDNKWVYNTKYMPNEKLDKYKLGFCTDTRF